MAIYRNVHLSFWTDPKVIDEFTPEDRYFFLYLMTNPHTNLCGCYEVSIKQISDETGYTKETVEKLIGRMEKVHEVIEYSKSTKEIYINNWHKYNWTESEKVLSAIEKQVLEIKNPYFRKKASDTLCIGYGYPMDTTDTDTVSDTVSDSDIESIKEIINYLNNICNTHYRYQVQKTQTLIRARIKEKFTVDDFKTVIKKKYDEWGSDKEMSKYLRPETLFGTKFEGYLNQKSTTNKNNRLNLKEWAAG